MTRDSIPAELCSLALANFRQITLAVLSDTAYTLPYDWVKEGKAMKVLVCGGVKQKNPLIVSRIMDEIHRVYGLTEVILQVTTGAPQLVKDWCVRKNISCSPYRPLWEIHDREAGPKSYQAMLRLNPDIGLIITFSLCKRIEYLLSIAKEREIPIMPAREFYVEPEEEFPRSLHSIEPGLSLMARFQQKIAKMS